MTAHGAVHVFHADYTFDACSKRTRSQTGSLRPQPSFMFLANQSHRSLLATYPFYMTNVAYQTVAR